MGADEDPWSAVAEGWSQLWGPSGAPVWPVLLGTTGVGPGTRLLDVGCGSGELLRAARGRGGDAVGVDPAPGMARRAARHAPGAVVIASADDLPFPDATFDVVTCVNALHLADDVDDALAEAVRVLRPDGWVALAGWAEGSRNDLQRIEAAVARRAGDDVPPDGLLHREGGFEELLRDAGLAPVAAGLVEVPWQVPDDDALVRGVLLGEDAAGLADARAMVVEAARPFRSPDGGYRLVNRYRWAVARA
ncbi:class I SAM-dependent methyltransferase [Actinotalea sp. JY-7876]|uniref:class I SAM-dependent methyltransferase n=1 Tax=Actinotalea sp. JY-7876 TaxID=2758442 RepID=UPI0015F5E8D1|nr:class I SAM-dependent methyltransferase [Actinotalea sp. JY-7876]